MKISSGVAFKHSIFSLSLMTLMLGSNTSFAMDSLSENEMSQQSAQDGLTILINSKDSDGNDGSFSASYLTWVDTSGLRGIDAVADVTASSTGTQLFDNVDGLNDAGAGRVNVNFSGNQAVVFYNTNTTSGAKTVVKNPLMFSIDVDGGNGSSGSAAFVGKLSTRRGSDVVNHVLGTVRSGGVDVTETVNNTTVTDIEINIKDINLLEQEGVQTVILSFDSSIKISLVEPMVASLILAGNKAGVEFESLNISEIDLGRVNIYSKNGSSIKTGIQVNGLDLSGLKMDVNQQGLVMGMGENSELTVSKVHIGAYDGCSIDCGILLGDSGATSAESYSGIKNASVGQIQMSGITVKNPTLLIKGF